ncbi:MAG: hypothetical protein HY243_00350 [Proteobacteria bacterium]|nr:hypothetical protein [Pseudomonadota bacterium]
MLKFIAGMILGGILAMYPALAYPQQLHNALVSIGLGSLLPSPEAPQQPNTDTPKT